MAVSALEEKINKIRQQNEEIRRRHEEVEEDKKNAAKLNALVQMVPSTDWPERKEPPEFSNSSITNNKPRLGKDHHAHSQQYHSVGGEGRKIHVFAQGQGPPPDPKYNFLADSEREEGNTESAKDTPPNRGQKTSRGGMFRRKHGGKDGTQKDYRTNKGSHRDERQPEYEAWRAERNRIDEDRISRQRTAEGNWRREWDNDKAHVVDDLSKPEAKLGNYIKKDHKYHINGNDYAHHNRGSNHRSYRGNSRHFHNNYENRSNNAYQQDGHAKSSMALGSEERTVIATDKSIKVMLNQGNVTKGPLMSVKVNSPSIAGTGRVGPRQRSRITYSSHSDVEIASAETTDSFSRPKSFEDKNKGIYHDNLQKSSNTRKSQPLSKKKDLGNKSPYLRKKEIRKEDAKEDLQKYHETELKASYAQKEHNESQKFCHRSKSQMEETDIAEPLQNDEAVTTHFLDERESNITTVTATELDGKDTEFKAKDNQTDLNTHLNDSEVYKKLESESVLQNSDLPMFEVETKIETCTVAVKENKSDETQIVQAAALSECKLPKADLITPSTKDVNDDDKSDTKSVMLNYPLYDINDDTEEIVKENKEQNLPTEQTNEIVSDDCGSEQNKDESKQMDGVIKRDMKELPLEKETDEITRISSSTDASSVVKKNMNELESNDKVLEKKKILVAESVIAATDERIDSGDKQNIMMCTNENQEHVSDNNDDEKSNPAQIAL